MAEKMGGAVFCWSLFPFKKSTSSSSQPAAAAAAANDNPKNEVPDFGCERTLSALFLLIHIVLLFFVSMQRDNSKQSQRERVRPRTAKQLLFLCLSVQQEQLFWFFFFLMLPFCERIPTKRTVKLCLVFKKVFLHSVFCVPAPLFSLPRGFPSTFLLSLAFFVTRKKQ
ncbi:hypothetical protein BX661DRAFT_87898 [Kickxella alabastrina]|uniref:uncharacterized protein n=1 Tax=Kickxella alabastrina TaxID=61397 RepID=UPI0022202D79|nr:uncharacterized protein BX661DRAFT_87898 [Kickxella alabastrina]KAI7832162.1 hypothetical protein BX661DRAFT_87898 [Kickxella alabastrina]